MFNIKRRKEGTKREFKNAFKKMCVDIEGRDMSQWKKKIVHARRNFCFGEKKLFFTFDNDDDGIGECSRQR